MTVAVPHIARMSPYALAKTSSIHGKAPIVLSQNESFRPPSPHAMTAATDCLQQSFLYPDPDWTELRRALADLHGLDPEQILCGNGSLDLIGAIARVFSGPERSVLAPAHAYPFFRTATEMSNAQFITAPEMDITADVDAMLRCQRPDTGVVFVANPGNPTGTRISKAELIRLRAGLRPDVLLVIDEAYGEFSDHLGEQCFDMVLGNNTVVLRTFSKAYGMAGFRVGWGAFPQEIREELRKVMNPNNVSLASQSAAVAAAKDQSYMRETCAITRDLKIWAVNELQSAGFRVQDSLTNFVLIRFDTEHQVRDAEGALMKEAVYLRRQTAVGLPRALRMTIGDKKSVKLAVSTLQSLTREAAT